MEHTYNLTICWTGNLGKGTKDYSSYSRNHTISAIGKPEIKASSDPVFRGDKKLYNPEELLVAALSTCHMLWFLHLCANNGIVVTDYKDHPSGIMVEKQDGSGFFKEVTLNPVVTVANYKKEDRLKDIHELAYNKCFIANSVNFPVKHNPSLILTSNG